ncbi:MAG: hypothetical protein ACK511_13915, partial [Burkholderiales bacterium]
HTLHNTAAACGLSITAATDAAQRRRDVCGQRAAAATKVGLKARSQFRQVGAWCPEKRGAQRKLSG